MTQQFHEGQDVEVKVEVALGDHYDAPMSTAKEWHWREAKIVSPTMHTHRELYTVQFPEPDGKYDVDGERAVFDAEHIRAVPNRDLAKMTPVEFQEDINDCYGGKSS